MARLILPPHAGSVIIGGGYRLNVPVFYCDESGRSGPNYLDPNQPVHVLAGYVIPEHWHWKLTGILKPIADEVAPAEPKASRMFRLPRRHALLSKYLGAMEREFLSVVVVVHKRYFAGLKLDEAVLNPRIAASARWIRRTPEVLQETAEVLSSLSDSTFRLFRLALDEGAPEALARCIQSSSRELRDRGHGDLARFFAAARRDADRLSAALNDDVSAWDFRRPTGERVRAGATLDFDAFLWCLQRANDVIARASHEPNLVVDVVADHADEEVAFGRLFGLLGDRFDRLRSLRFEDSSRVRGLQAADLLAGAARYLAEGREVTTRLQPGFDEMVRGWFTSSMQAVFFGPRAFVNRARAAASASWRRQRNQREALLQLLRRRLQHE